MQPPEAFELWPAGPPDGLLQHGQAEILNDHTGPDQRLNRIFASVSRPSITIHRPIGQAASRTAVVVFPGGGYKDVWIDKEGYDIARWLNTLGVTAFVVKYRVLPGSAHDLPYEQLPSALMEEVMAASLADGLRAVRWVRQRSAQWQIDPNSTGVIGFSAGGHLILRMLEQAGQGDPGSADPVECMSSRPDFSILAYPAVPGELGDLPADSGPVFIAQAADDEMTPATGAVRLLQELLKKNIPVEAHIFRQGRHGFGLGIEGGGVRNWMLLCENWLRELGSLAV